MVVLLTSGMKPLRFFRPFLIFGIAATVFLVIFSLFLGPSGMRYTKFKIHEIRHDLSGTLVRDGMFSMPVSLKIFLFLSLLSNFPLMKIENEKIINASGCNI